MAAFERDICRWAASSPLVLIFDHVDKATATLQNWLDERVVGRLCLGRQAAPQLRIVLAARPGSFVDRYVGDGMPALHAALEPMDDHELVKQLLRVNNLLPDGDDDDLVTFVRAKLASRRWSVGQAVKIVQSQLACADAAWDST